jgi:hypothetical protein
MYFSSADDYAFARNGIDCISLTGSGIFIGNDIHFETANDQIIFDANGTLSNPNIIGTVSDSGVRFKDDDVEIVRTGTKIVDVTDLGIAVTGTGTATVDWTISSDIRLKENIEPITSALDAILSMRGVHFDWTKDSGRSGPQVGVIAQEVQKVIPTAVTEGEDGFLSVSTQQLVAVLIEAVRELSEKIDGNSR